MRVGAVAVAVALLAMPGAAASWMGKGTWEPDTAADTRDGWMTLAPDTTSSQSVRKVYFNGFIGEYSGTFNPNLATIEMSTFHGNSWSFYAMLGVWKDCNRDGYVGVGEAGQWEYRAELLSATADANTCPTQTTPIDVQTGKPPPGWFPSHNDGEWVREWLPISWLPWDAPSDPSPWDINDNGSRVWADFGRLHVDQPPWGNCWLTPHPRGTYHSTGGMIQHYDCYAGHKFTDVWNAVILGVGGDNLGAGQLSFADHPNDQRNSASQLNRPNPWGEESDASYVQAWDCSDDPTQVQVPSQTVTLPTGHSQRTNDVNLTNVSSPNASPSPNAAGSPSGTMNATFAGLDRCHRESEPGHAAGARARTPYALEGDVLNGGVKVQPSGTLAPNWAARPAAPYRIALGDATPPGPDFGSRLTSDDGFWQDATASHLAEPTVFNDRFDIMFRWERTYYAYVSPAAVSAYGLTLPKGSLTGVYGAEACGAATSGIRNNWNCDATAWWKDGSGKDIEPRTGTLSDGGTTFSARPGSLYNLRDVDCYDWSVGALRDAQADVATVAGHPCERSG